MSLGSAKLALKLPKREGFWFKEDFCDLTCTIAYPTIT